MQESSRITKRVTQQKNKHSFITKTGKLEIKVEWRGRAAGIVLSRVKQTNGGGGAKQFLSNGRPNM
jgi:hypothetical protein